DRQAAAVVGRPRRVTSATECSGPCHRTFGPRVDPNRSSVRRGAPLDRTVLHTAMAWLLLVCGSLACEGPATAFQGPCGDVTVDARFEIASPADPQPPALTPCPAGWSTTGDLTPACEPWPDGGPLTCPDGWAHLPGEAQCSAIGAPCPSGPWADGFPQ